MLSYTDVVREGLDEALYARGLRLYLEGKVGRYQELSLDFWREYDVRDTHDTFKVRLPLLHLAIDSEKWSQAGRVIGEFARCECAYFEEYGLCKHIVAVCAALEKEFGTKHQNQVAGVDSVLDKVFEVEQEKLARVWEQRLETFLTTTRPDSLAWLAEMVLKVQSKPENYKQLLARIKLLSQQASLDFVRERRLATVIKDSLVVGGLFWWEFWRPFFENLTEKKLLELNIELWKIYIGGLAKDFKPNLEFYMRELSNPTKTQMLEKLQHDFIQNRSFWLEFIFISRFTTWLEANYTQLDPLSLIRTCELLPELREEVELEILRQVRIWADFLQPGEYDEVTKVFQRWSRILGRSDFFEQAVKYFKDSHPKKKKLLTGLEN
jgi:SWIM zinc finger